MIFFEIFIILISIIACLLGFTNFYKKIEYNKKIKKDNIELQRENIYLKTEQDFEKEKLKIIQNRVSELKNVQSTYENNAQQSFSNYCDILDKEYDNKEKEYNNLINQLENSYNTKCDELYKKIDEVKNNLEKLRNTRAAAIQAFKKEQEIENKINFYKIQIDDQDKKEIYAIKNIEYLFRDTRPLNMMIWSNYYLKKANALCNNILSKDIVCGIYKITNIKNKMCYIGQAKNIKERLREHMKHGLGIDCPSNNKLYELMKKDGLEAFTFEVLEECDPSLLNEKEKFYIDLYDSCNNGLNNNKGIGLNKYI